METIIQLMFCTKASKGCSSQVLFSLFYICGRTERPPLHQHRSNHLLLLQNHTCGTGAQTEDEEHTVQGRWVGVSGGRLLQGPPPVSTVVDVPESRGAFLSQSFHFYRLVADEHLTLSALL